MNEMLIPLAPRMHMVNPPLQCNSHGRRAFGRRLGHNYITVFCHQDSADAHGDKDLTGNTPGVSRTRL